MRILAIGMLAGAACLLGSADALAAKDHCALLDQNGDYCATLNYSNGDSASFSVGFSDGSTFYLGGVSQQVAGIYQCWGESLFEVNYATPENEQNYWIGKVSKGGSAKGLGHMVNSFGYLYTLNLQPGLCAAPHQGKPSASGR